MQKLTLILALLWAVGGLAQTHTFPARETNNPQALFADRFPGADACAKINAAIRALPATGGIVDATGFHGPQACASDPFANTGSIPGGIPPLLLRLGGGAVFQTAAQWKPRWNQQVQCEAPGNYNSFNGHAVIQPVRGFAPTAVVNFDPANENSVDHFITGVGMSNCVIDMTNVAAASKIALQLLSVSNAGPWDNITVLNQDSGQYLYIGCSANSGAQVSDGETFKDFFALSKTTDPANADPGVIIEEANEIDFVGGRTKIMRRSTTGGFAAGSVGILVRSQNIGANHINFEGISIASYETALKIARVAGIAPRWVRLLDSTIENFRYGMHVDGDSVSSPQFFIGRGNRFITPRGSSPRNYRLDHAQHGTIEADEYAEQSCMPGCMSSLAVELTANSMSNKIYAMPAEVSDAGKYNIVLGRSGAIGSTGALWSIGTGQQISAGLAINSAGSGNPQLLLQRDGKSQGILRLNSTFIQNGIDIVDGTGQGITLNGSNLVPTANGSALGMGGKAWAGTFTAVNTAALQLTSHVRPACDVAHRGLLNYLAGGTGVKDTVEICLKDATDAYSWKTIY